MEDAEGPQNWRQLSEAITAAVVCQTTDCEKVVGVKLCQTTDCRKVVGVRQRPEA